jgi:hypothetical protein
LSASELVSGLTFSVARGGQTLAMQLTQAEIDSASGGATSLMDHLRALIGPQMFANLDNLFAGSSTRATQPSQPTIGHSLNGQLEAHRSWMSDMLTSLQNFFASFKTNAKADASTN